MQALSERFELRLDQNTLDRIDIWRGEQGDFPSRAQAVRRLVEYGLSAGKPAKKDLDFSAGERLIVAMLIDMMRAGKIKGETNTDLVAEILYGGHQWALDWEMGGLFHNHVDDPAVLSETVDMLDMWDMLETSYEALSADAQKRIKDEAKRFGSIKFLGFDGNGETEYLSIARFLVEKLGRFSRFKGRDFNSHMPGCVETYRRMLSTFLPIRPRLMGRWLSSEEILAIMAEAIHPERRSRT